MHIFYLISLSSSSNEKCFRQKLYRTSKHTFYISFENRAVYETICKNIVAGHKWQYSSCSLDAGYLTLQTHTPSMWHLVLFTPQLRFHEGVAVLIYPFSTKHLYGSGVLATSPVDLYLECILYENGAIMADLSILGGEKKFSFLSSSR